MGLSSVRLPLLSLDFIFEVMTGRFSIVSRISLFVICDALLLGITFERTDESCYKGCTLAFYILSNITNRHFVTNIIINALILHKVVLASGAAASLIRVAGTIFMQSVQTH